jgi:hypothetical protein
MSPGIRPPPRPACNVIRYNASERRRAFTIVELLVGSSLAAMAMAALLSSFVFVGRNFTRMANFRALEQEGRTGLAYLEADLAQARAVKTGSTPTATSLTLVLAGGDVIYTYDATSDRLRRQAAFDAQPDRYFLSTSACRCTDFAFSYYTGSSEAPADQLTPSANVPLSIKQVQVSFTLRSPTAESTQTQMEYPVVSPRYHLRNKRAPDGN